MQPRLRILLAVGLVAVVTFGFVPRGDAQALIRTMSEQAEKKGESAVLPFAFYSDTTDLGIGLAGAVQGFSQQEQFFLGAAAFGSTNGSYGFYFLADDLRLIPDGRLFLYTEIGITRYEESEEFIDGNPAFPGQAGSNDSLQEDFVDSRVFSAYGIFKFKYVLPIGTARENPIATYTLDRGVLSEGATGGFSLNPLESGRTFVEVTPYASWRHVTAADDEPIPQDSFDTFGLQGGLRWDNTDLPVNPSRGNSTTIRVARDFDIFSSAGQYTTIQFDHSQYIPLGQNEWFRQQVLALNLWVASEVAGDTPYYLGATLGGYHRLRAYPTSRFHDRNAIYGAAELRLMAAWRPTTTVRELDELAKIDWVQFVFFGEAGRVGPSFSADDLLTDFKWDLGCGLRMMVHKSVVRADVAWGEEGGSLWVMLGQAF